MRWMSVLKSFFPFNSLFSNFSIMPPEASNTINVIDNLSNFSIIRKLARNKIGRRLALWAGLGSVTFAGSCGGGGDKIPTTPTNPPVTHKACLEDGDIGEPNCQPCAGLGEYIFKNIDTRVSVPNAVNGKKVASVGGDGNVFSTEEPLIDGGIGRWEVHSDSGEQAYTLTPDEVDQLLHNGGMTRARFKQSKVEKDESPLIIYTCP